MPTRLEDLAEAVHVTLSDPSVLRQHGRLALNEHSQSRRVVWISEGGSFDDPKQGGGRPPGDGTAFRIQSCKTRLPEVQAHIYAETPETAEQLLDNLVAAICLTVPRAAFRGYRVVTEERNREGHNLRTQKIILRLTVRWPVPDEIKPLVTITDANHTCGTIQPDGTILPEPTS